MAKIPSITDVKLALQSSIRWHEEEERPHSAGVDRDALALIESLAESLRALAEAKALKEVEGVVAGWNGPDPDKPYERHPSNLGATIRTNCKGMYDLADALKAARSTLKESDHG